MKKLYVHIRGVVQGVGFRPFVHSLAEKYLLKGWVINDSRGVEIEVTGDESTLRNFMLDLSDNPPPLAQIVKIKSEITDIPESEAFNTFEIRKSVPVEGERVLISPDVAVCHDCLREMYTPSDRRYRYPFLNCTNCGPRFTIIEDLPYDRPFTTMREFPMCDSCAREYENPADGRFHAQPTCCPDCGPSLQYLDEIGKKLDVDPIEKIIDDLKSGKIVAIKGIGGFHLACDASNPDAVMRLRSRKHREQKPLAVMAGGIASAGRLAYISTSSGQALMSSARPIVICQLKNDAPVAGVEISGGLNTIGIMLPYAPLHHLIFRSSHNYPPEEIGGTTGIELDNFNALVMTSGNLTDEPIAIDNIEAVERLRGIADSFLVNDRKIHRRCDDSVTMSVGGKANVWRFGRGHVPRAVFLPEPLPPVLAVGAELKNTICNIREDKAFISPHIGDLKTLEAWEYFREVIEHQKNILDVKPEYIAADLHPDYHSTRWADEQGELPVIRVQHHFAHAVSLMAEHAILNEEIIALSMDGTGLGDDRNIWGGEVMKVSVTGYERLGHFSYSPLPGGDAAVKEIWRSAMGRLWKPDVGIPDEFRPLFENAKNAGAVEKQIKADVNCPKVCSLGRLFDAAAFVAGVLNPGGIAGYDGQAPAMLEAACRSADDSIKIDVLKYFENRGDEFLVDGSMIIADLARLRLDGKSPAEMSRWFHSVIAGACVEMAVRAKNITGIDTVGLTGGCFMNSILLVEIPSNLKERNIRALTHSGVPTNDGGISLGQAVIAGYMVSM